MSDIDTKTGSKPVVSRRESLYRRTARAALILGGLAVIPPAIAFTQLNTARAELPATLSDGRPASFADLAQKVQSEVRGNTVVMNNEDVRSVVETSVNAVVRNYDIDSAGYDPNSTKYRVRISIRGEQLVKEIERRRTARFE